MKQLCWLSAGLVFCLGSTSHLDLLEAAPAIQQQTKSKDYVSPDGAFHIQATRITEWPPPDQGQISGPPPTRLLDGSVIVRPLKPHKGVQVRAAYLDRLVLEETGADTPVVLDAVHFDVNSETVRDTNGVMVFRDGSGRSLTIYPAGGDSAEKPRKR